MSLNEIQQNTIWQRLVSADIRNKEFAEELFDHLCSVTEERYEGSVHFDKFLEQELESIAPHGLKYLEIQINYSSYSKLFIIMKKVTYFIGLLSSISLSSGVLFKLMKWPGANMLLLCGVTLLFLFFVPYMAFERWKAGRINNGLDKARVTAGVMASVIVALSVLFKFFELMGANILFVVGMILFVTLFLPLQFIKLYRDNSPKTQTTK